MSSRSNDSSSFADALTTHTKPPRAPRSLHDVEDADIIWDAITRRFPNAAPLLCEMETVIERAEDLLQQLKTTCPSRENDTSSSFHTPDSRESNATISIGSDIESFAEETPNVTEVAETVDNESYALSQQVVRQTQVDLESEHSDEQFVHAYEDEHRERRSDSSPRLCEIVGDFHTTFNKRNTYCDTRGELDTMADKGFEKTSEERLMAMISEQNSLEGWSKLTDDTLHMCHGDDVTDTTVSTKENDSETGINKNTDDYSLIINHDSKCDESDVILSDKSDDTLKVIVTNTSTQNSISTSSVTIRDNYRSPLAILEEYAKRCKVLVKYEYRSKPNLYVINGDLCGFRAMSCAETQDRAKNELATKILWMVAEQQMDGTKLSSSICGLSELSRDEMLEVIEIASKGALKNASQKLYKFCLERAQPIPEYSIRHIRTNKGFMYMAQCAALGLVGVGQGLRKDRAKIAAAENLYEKYVHEVEQEM